MRNPFQIGETKVHRYKVLSTDLAGFGDAVIHPVCSTFALGREMEWSSRMFVLEMIEEDEEGIGTSLQITHHSPALEDEDLTIVATLERIVDNEILCKIKVKVADRLIASGKTGQKILKRTKIASLLDQLSNG